MRSMPGHATTSFGHPKNLTGSMATGLQNGPRPYVVSQQRIWDMGHKLSMLAACPKKCTTVASCCCARLAIASYCKCKTELQVT